MSTNVRCIMCASTIAGMLALGLAGPAGGQAPPGAGRMNTPTPTPALRGHAAAPRHHAVPNMEAPARAATTYRAPVEPEPTKGAATSAIRPEILLERGQQAQAKGDLAGAAQAYGEARQAAKEHNAKHVGAQAALDYARTLEMAGPQTAPAEIAKAKAAYEEVRTTGTPVQRVQAENNLAVIALRQGDQKQAIALLQGVDTSTLEPDERARYQYNYARALEQDGNLIAAFQAYQKALKGDPSLDLATTGAFRTLRATTPPPVSEASRLASSLLTTGQEADALHEVRESLELWAADPDAQQLLAVLVQYHATAKATPEQFRISEGDRLSRLAVRGPQLARAVAQLRTAMRNDLPIVVDHNQATMLFDAWAPQQWKVRPFGALLKTFGDAYDKAGDHRQALASYALAWAIDPANTDAALYAAVTMSDHSTALDPSGRLLKRLAEGLFNQKLIAYADLDWTNILRLHTVLGTIFERQGKWWGTPGDSRTALAQWTFALRAEGHVKEQDPASAPSPGLYQHLADCYEKKGDAAQAWENHVRAARAFLDAQKPVDAAKATEDAKGLGLVLTPAQQGVVRALEQDIARSPASPNGG